MPYPPLTTRNTNGKHAECKAKIEELEEECNALGRTLHDLKTHVENVPADSFRYPDTVGELLERADTLLDGEVPDIMEKKRTLENIVANFITSQDPLTQGEWHVEGHPDGSWWVMGPDPQDGEPVLVAACEMEADARHIAQMHNTYAGDTDA